MSIGSKIIILLLTIFLLATFFCFVAYKAVDLINIQPRQWKIDRGFAINK
jgi:hypothetical protein